MEVRKMIGRWRTKMDDRERKRERGGKWRRRGNEWEREGRV